MPRSLYGRFALVLLVLVVALGLFGLFGTWATTSLYREEVEQRLNLDLAEHLLAEGPLMIGGEVDQERLGHLLHMVMVINPRLEIYILDGAGFIRAFSAEVGQVRLEKVDLGPVRQLLAGDDRLPIRGDDPRHPDRRVVFSVARIAGDAGSSGYLYVVLGGEHYESIASRVRDSLILRLSAIWGLALVLLVAALGAVISYLLTRRLRRLDSRIHEYRAAQERKSSPPTPNGVADEIARLERSFEALRERIDDQVREIEEMERHRRELVANVSHDLRTPLATLQGYLETVILKGESLGMEERHEYLEIAYRQSEALGRLIQQLFELAMLEAGDSHLEVASFSLAELIQDVAAKFRLACERRGVALLADLPIGSSTTVTGDLRLLERGLDNLLENALHHTPAGGSISVALRTDKDSVEVRVSDTGSGIPPEDLERIFRRFYRGTRSEEANSGSGLGLAIVRRIVELHGSTIRAASTEGSGATFVFQLSRAA